MTPYFPIYRNVAMTLQYHHKYVSIALGAAVLAAPDSMNGCGNDGEKCQIVAA